MSETLVEHGNPGGFARRLAWRARSRAALAMVVSAVCVYIPFQFPVFRGDGRLLVGLLVAASLSGGLARHWLGASRAAAVGAASERRVAKVLRSLNPVALLHSVDLRAGGDADHLVLGPWLVTVETKTGAGPVRYTDGKLYVGARQLRGDPLAQCRRQARAARKDVGSFCDAIVCVVDMENKPFTHNHVTVCSLRDLPGEIRKLTSRVSASAARTHAQRLAPRTSTVHAPLPDRRPGQNTSNTDTAPRSPASSQIRPFPDPSRNQSHPPTPGVTDRTFHPGTHNEEKLGNVPFSRKFRAQRQLPR